MTITIPLRGHQALDQQKVGGAFDHPDLRMLDLLFALD